MLLIFATKNEAIPIRPQNEILKIYTLGNIGKILKKISVNANFFKNFVEILKTIWRNVCKFFCKNFRIFLKILEELGKVLKKFCAKYLVNNLREILEIEKISLTCSGNFGKIFWNFFLYVIFFKSTRNSLQTYRKFFSSLPLIFFKFRRNFL